MKTYSRPYMLVVFVLLIAFTAACNLGRKSATQSDEKGRSSAGNASTATSAPAIPMANIAGKYNVTGTNPDGAAYHGTLEVIAHGDVYQFRWNAGSQYDGVGIVNGDVWRYRSPAAQTARAAALSIT